MCDTGTISKILGIVKLYCFFKNLTAYQCTQYLKIMLIFLLFRLPEMAEFIRRCEEFLVEEFSPLDSQWSNEDFLSLSANGLQKGLFFYGIIRDRSSLTEQSSSAPSFRYLLKTEINHLYIVLFCEQRPFDLAR